ncbi:MAG: hypothetical protein LUE17_12745 [Planctomycetaceae bacterium]|nr:hypothetical protein [Planctomycetaceae bacterium]
MDIFDNHLAKPMLIGRDEGPFDSPDYLFELKVDGERSLAYVDGASTVLINRHGRHILPNFPELAGLHDRVDGKCILDGELVVGSGSKDDFEGIKSRWATKHPLAIQRLSREKPATYVAVDILYQDGRQVTDEPLDRRRERLLSVVHEGGRVAVSRAVNERGVDFFEIVKQQGMEGIIGKRRDSVYRMGKRTKDWVKIKHWLEDEFVVCGVVDNAKAAVVSLVLGQYRADGVLAYKGRVTLGRDRDEYRAIKRLPRAARNPFDVALPPGSAGATWVTPRLVARVGFMAWTTGNKLRQPFFVGLVPGAKAKAVVEHVPALV